MMKRLYFILLAIIAYACVEIPSNLSAPEWDVELNLPITDRFYNIDSLLKDSEYGRTEQIGNYLVYSFYSDTITYKNGISNLLRNRLDFEYLNYSFPLAEGEIELDIPLPDSIQIETASFLDGESILEIQNLSDKSFQYSIEFLDFDKNGNTVLITNEIDAKQNDFLDIDLAETNFKPLAGNSISIKVTAKGTFDSNKDSSRISLRMKNTVLRHIRGTLPPTFVENISESVDIDFDSEVDDFRNNIKLDGAEMFLFGKYISSLNDVPEVKLSNLSILGEYANSSLQFKENDDSVLEDILITGKEFSKVYNSENSNVNDFLAFLPSVLSLSGNCLVNPDNKVFEASIYDSIEVNSFIRTPLRMSIDSLSIKDTVEHDLGEDKENLADAGRAIVISKITNGLPLTIDAYISIVDNTYNNIVTKKVSIAPAEIISDIEFSPIISEVEIPLDSLELNNISKSFYVIYDLQLKGNKDQFVTFKASDGIDIKSHINADYRIKED